MTTRLVSTIAVLALAACSDTAGSKADATRADAGAAGDGGAAFASGDEARIAVPATGRAYLKLGAPPGPVTPADPQTDRTWDLAFEGFDVFTNGGPSGSGAAQAFGPLEPLVFIDDVAPQVPFMFPDKTGGAFIRWYYYEGAPNHALYSRFHVFGVKDGDRSYKVQILAYYGERDGAPISALYRIRWAEVTAEGVKPTQEVANLDGTGQGADAPGECIDLGTGARTMLTPAAARTSSAWHLCFRRQDISVNGELGGPRNVRAADLDLGLTNDETVAQILGRTPESEQARFDAVDAKSFEGHELRGDRIVSAFSGSWLARGASPPAPAESAWLVVGADGKSKHLVGFSAFEGATATSPGTVVMRVKAVK
jgi:hypothetical protein